MCIALGLAVAACAPASQAPSSGEPVESEPAVSEGPFSATSYPEAGAQDCDYGGEFSRIAALDQLTVEFTLCFPDPAFLSKIAFTSNAIQDSGWLNEAMANHLLLARPVGTGPYQFGEYVRGDHVTLNAFDGYWGDPAIASQLVVQWNAESSARLLALQSGQVDGIDNPGPNDFAAIEGNADLQLLPREALNVMYIGFTNTFDPWSDVRVRQAIAMGIDRNRIVDNFYPGGSEVADYFTPCNIENGCSGDPWYDYDLAGAQALLTQAGLGSGFSTNLYYRNVVRGYLPDPVVVATDIQAQLAALNITVTPVEQESGTFLDNSSAGLLDGLYLLGWGADYPDPTNFLDYHFNNPGNLQFGPIDASITEPLDRGAQTLDPDVRAAAYVEANNAIRAFVPMVPVAHGASATAWKADVVGAHSSPLTSEEFWTMDPGGRDVLVWMQNAYPLSLYCGDESDGETLRLCEQINEPLYKYETGATAAVPGLATSCDPNADATVWTCHLRENVSFHNGTHLDANDVVLTFAIQWDTLHPLHIGRSGAFEYFSGLFGAYLPVPVESGS